MKRLISLLLMICLLAPGTAVRAEEEMEEAPAVRTEEEREEVPMVPGHGYSFDFEVQLHPEAFSDGGNERIRGYAELVGALRFEGTFQWVDNWDVFDLNLRIIPKTRPDGAVDVRLHGAQDLMFLNSSLMEDRTVALGNSSMLAFCTKMSEQLGISLQYPALLYPYTWTYALALPIQDVQGLIGMADAEGYVPPERVEEFWSWWRYRLEFDENVRMLEDALCRNSDAEDAFRGMFHEIPDFFLENVAGRQGIRIRSEGGETRWTAASGEFYRAYDDGRNSGMELTVPRMRTGYQPVFSLEKVRENGFVNSRLSARLLGDEDRKDLVSLQASLISFPEKWPVRCSSLMSLNLTGELLPNIGCAVVISGEENGHLRAEVRKPTVDLEPGAVLLSLEGDLIPMEEGTPIRVFTLWDLEGALELFSANDAEIRAFVPELAEPIMQGMLGFLAGIPTKACQTIMDDLTEMGVFQVLMGN